jgi:DNA polymerase-3 subunit gamma/tau
MLSKSAWNAFLKTLEEPPKHTLFILATTELERVPETVQSRCQVFEFKKPSRAALAKLATEVAKKEGYALAPDAAELVALLAEGSYRDALSVLQKVLTSSTDKKLVREEVEKATGAPKRELVHALVAALAANDKGKALTAVERAAKSGADMRLFLELLIETLRNALLIRYAPDLRDDIKTEIGNDEFDVLSKYSSITHQMLLAFLTASERIRYAPIEALPLELAVLELFPE